MADDSLLAPISSSNMTAHGETSGFGAESNDPILALGVK